jgi:hypothetical protein
VDDTPSSLQVVTGGVNLFLGGFNRTYLVLQNVHLIEQLESILILKHIKANYGNPYQSMRIEE